jgi:hypothetical protein
MPVVARESAAQGANWTQRVPGRHWRRVSAASPEDVRQCRSCRRPVKETSCERLEAGRVERRKSRTDMPRKKRSKMRRLLKGAPVGGRLCERCVRCKGGAVAGVSQRAHVRGRVRAETPGRLCSSASGRRGEPGLQRAGGDRRCSKERGWDQVISEQGDAKRRERGEHNRAAEERCKIRRLPTSAHVRGTVYRRRVRGKITAV